MSLTSFFDLCVASLIPFNPWWRATTCAFSVQVLPKLWRIITIREQTKYHHILWLHSKHMMWKPRPFSAKKIKNNNNKKKTSNPMQNFDLRRRSLNIKLFPMNVLSSLKCKCYLFNHLEKPHGIIDVTDQGTNEFVQVWILGRLLRDTLWLCCKLNEFKMQK